MLNRLALRRHGYNVKRTTDLACVRLGARAYMRTHRHTCAHIHMHTHIPIVRHVDRRGGRATNSHAYLDACPHKSQKVWPKVWKAAPPVAISCRFLLTGVDVKWVYYPTHLPVQPKFLTLLYDYRDTQHDTDRSECRIWVLPAWGFCWLLWISFESANY